MVAGEKSAMSRITKISSVFAAILTFSVSGAYAADSKCGAQPPLPELPADGAALASKEMDAVAKSFDDYQAKFQEYNKCLVGEFNTTQKKFEEIIDAYSSKGKKK
jgi:hypothetical protein